MFFYFSLVLEALLAYDHIRFIINLYQSRSQFLLIIVTQLENISVRIHTGIDCAFITKNLLMHIE